MAGDSESALDIRLGTPADFEAVLEIQRRAYLLKEVPLYGENLPPLLETAESLAREAETGKRLVVGLAGGRVRASLRMEAREDGSVYFGRLSVDPDCQGRGFGQLMALAVEGLNPDAAEFVLDCGVDSVENYHIYEKLGYRRTGRFIQVENGPKCEIMRKSRSGAQTGK